MGIARSTYYYSCRRSPEDEALEQRLKVRIESLSIEFPGYGQRRIYHQLRREGYTVNHKRIERIVRELKLQCRLPRAYRPTTNSTHSFQRYPNLIKNIVPVRPDQIWVADITYIRLRSTFVYLSVILDLFSRKVTGYALSKTLDAACAIKALEMALAQRHPSPGCIHHSDQGGQYASLEYVRLLKEQGLISSMSSKGNPYENATAESFFKTFKYEEVYLNDYSTISDVVDRVPQFIEDVYNAKRLHSSLEYLSPDEFEARFNSNGATDVPKNDNGNTGTTCQPITC